MSSKTINGIRFNAYSNDHDPPHIDAEVDGYKMKLVFETEDHYPEIRTADPKIKSNVKKRAFAVFCENQGLLREMYNKQNAKKS